MSYAYFVGCVSPVMGKQNEVATRRVSKELDIELIDSLDFACCGFPIKSVDSETSLLLAARNLSIAESLNLDVCTICTGCLGALYKANKDLTENDKLREKINKKLRKIGREYNTTVKVKHFVDVLYHDMGVEEIKNKVERPLNPLTIATHYGCHYVKPTHVFNKGEDPEFPSSLDKLITLTGAKSVEYEYKTQCCGGNLLGIDENITFTMASKKLDHITNTDADLISLICPLCNIIYERNQRIIEKRVDKSYSLPVLFFPQVLGLALGISPDELGFNMNRVKVSDLFKKIQVQHLPQRGPKHEQR